MNPPLGRCYYAVAPFAPEPPFEIYLDDNPPHVVQSAERMGEVARGGNGKFRVITSVKVRPVLAVSGVLAPYNEVLVMRLVRFDKLTDSEQSAVREQEHDELFHLKPDAFPGLKSENAAMVKSLIKIPVSAIDTTQELGQVNSHELSILHERFARAHGLRLDGLIATQVRTLTNLVKKNQS